MSNSLLEILFTILSIIVLVIMFVIGIVIVVTIFISFGRSRRSRRKQQAIRTYSKRLGRLLRARYGFQDNYAPDLIKAAIKEWGLDIKHACYAIVMYCDYPNFVEYHRSIGESCDYDAMCDEINECLFPSDSTFSTSETIDAGVRFDLEGDRSHSYNSSSSDDSSSCSYDGGGVNSYDGSNGSSYDSGSSCGSSCGSSSYDGGGGSCGGGDYGGGGY